MAISWLLIGSGIVLMIAGTVWSWSKTFRDTKEVQRKFFLGWGSYQLIYTFQHWDVMKAPFLAWLFGAILFVIGVVMRWV